MDETRSCFGKHSAKSGLESRRVNSVYACLRAQLFRNPRMVIFVIFISFSLLRTVFGCSVLFLLLITAFYKFFCTVFYGCRYCSALLLNAPSCFSLLRTSFNAPYLFYCSPLVYFLGHFVHSTRQQKIAIQII